MLKKNLILSISKTSTILKVLLIIISFNCSSNEIDKENKINNPKKEDVKVEPTGSGKKIPPPIIDPKKKSSKDLKNKKKLKSPKKDDDNNIINTKDQNINKESNSTSSIKDINSEIKNSNKTDKENIIVNPDINDSNSSKVSNNSNIDKTSNISDKKEKKIINDNKPKENNSSLINNKPNDNDSKLQKNNTFNIPKNDNNKIQNNISNKTKKDKKGTNLETIVNDNIEIDYDIDKTHLRNNKIDVKTTTDSIPNKNNNNPSKSENKLPKKQKSSNSNSNLKDNKNITIQNEESNLNINLIDKKENPINNEISNPIRSNSNIKTNEQIDKSLLSKETDKYPRNLKKSNIPKGNIKRSMWKKILYFAMVPMVLGSYKLAETYYKDYETKSSDENIPDINQQNDNTNDIINMEQSYFSNKYCPYTYNNTFNNSSLNHMNFSENNDIYDYCYPDFNSNFIYKNYLELDSPINNRDEISLKGNYNKEYKYEPSPTFEPAYKLNYKNRGTCSLNPKTDFLLQNEYLQLQMPIKQNKLNVKKTENIKNYEYQISPNFKPASKLNIFKNWRFYVNKYNKMDFIFNYLSNYKMNNLPKQSKIDRDEKLICAKRKNKIKTNQESYSNIPFILSNNSNINNQAYSEDESYLEKKYENYFDWMNSYGFENYYNSSPFINDKYIVNNQQYIITEQDGFNNTKPNIKKDDITTEQKDIIEKSNVQNSITNDDIYNINDIEHDQELEMSNIQNRTNEPVNEIQNNFDFSINDIKSSKDNEEPIIVESFNYSKIKQKIEENIYKLYSNLKESNGTISDSAKFYINNVISSFDNMFEKDNGIEEIMQNNYTHNPNNIDYEKLAIEIIEYNNRILDNRNKELQKKFKYIDKKTFVINKENNKSQNIMKYEGYNDNCQGINEQINKIEIENTECNLLWENCQQLAKEKDKLDNERVNDINKLKNDFNICNNKLKKLKEEKRQKSKNENHSQNFKNSESDKIYNININSEESSIDSNVDNKDVNIESIINDDTLENISLENAIKNYIHLNSIHNTYIQIEKKANTELNKQKEINQELLELLNPTCINRYDQLDQLEHDTGECNVEHGSCEQTNRQNDKLDEKRLEEIKKQENRLNLCNEQLERYINK